MTIVIGQIESLKRIRHELTSKGVSRFNSIGEINHFINNFDSIKKEAVLNLQKEVENEVKTLEFERSQLLTDFKNNTSKERYKLENKIEKLALKIENIPLNNSSSIKRIFYRIQRNMLEWELKQLRDNLENILRTKNLTTHKKIEEIDNKLFNLTNHRDKIVALRNYGRQNELARTKKIVDQLNTLIAGAIGEKKVEQELKKLSDSFILINDFSVNLNPPIYRKKEKDRIFSIQIDHLLVSHAGIFLIETKNWSKKSINNLDLRSPVNQIRRTSYALFTILNSENGEAKFTLENHHWGNKIIPIKNLIVMINHKPKAAFKHVKVLTLNQLNNYITKFEPVLEDHEIYLIAEHLKKINN